MDEARFRDRPLTHGDSCHAAFIVRNNNGISSDGAWRIYRPISTYANEVCDEAARHGVAVWRDVTLDDMAQAGRGCSVITFMSHIESVALQASDVLDAGALIGALERPRSVLQSAVAVRAHDVLEKDDALRGHLEAEGTPEVVAVLLNHVIYHESATFPHMARLGRVDMERAFVDWIAEAPCVEFADRMARGAETIDAIAPTWDGELDLSLCNSNQIGRGVKERAPGATCIYNELEASLMPRLMRYRLAVEILASGAHGFTETIMRVQETMGGLKR